MNKKYSDWLKIDLHIHSDFSAHTKERDYKGDFSVKVLKEKIIENNVEIFSITDHNIINIDAYREYYEIYDSKKDPLLLLGVELDIEVVNDATSKIYHAVLIFNVCDIAGVESISKTLESIYAGLRIFDKKSRMLSINDIANYFSGDDFFFIPHASSDKDIVKAYKDRSIEEAQRMVLLMPCALEKVTKEEAIHKYNEGFNKLLTISFQSKNDIPYINFSDNHCVNSYPCRHKGEDGIGDHDFYYIKGSKCYESIRLAFIDPESRIKTSRQYAEINHINNTLDSLKIENDGYVSKTELHFSPHLNVIIGGRSSGKSLLMWYLGEKMNINTKNNYGKYDPNNVQIKSKNDASYSVTTTQNNYIYIEQGDIIKYFEEGDLRELAKRTKKAEIYTHNLKLLQDNKGYLEKTIEDLIDAYEALFENNVNLKIMLHDKTINYILSSHYLILFDFAELKQKIDLTEHISTAKAFLDSLKENLEGLIKEKSILEISGDEEIIITKLQELVAKKNKLIQSKELANHLKIEFIDNVKTIIDKFNNSLNQEARQRQQAMSDLNEIKLNVSKRFLLIQELRYKAVSVEKHKSNTTTDFDIGDNIKLVLEASFIDIIRDVLIDGINNADKKQSLFYTLLWLRYDKYNLSIKNLGSNAPNKLKQKFSSQLASIYKAYDSPIDYLKYEDGEISKNKSPGYNSEKYLNIILSNLDVNIVIIDQPEDNLGNRFIADDLVKLIRKIKFEKQIFIVTHNPSVVVYGDAESVILAKNEDNIISYKQIVLEDSDAQKEICSILDGGEYIFDNRYKKYNIQRILKK